MDKTVNELLFEFFGWLFGSLLALSSLCNLLFWWYIGKAIWYHHSGYLVVALWWFIATIPSAISKVYYKRKQKKEFW